MRSQIIEHKFVEQFPDNLEREILYISIDFATAAHLCCCGCGQEVVTPFSPTDWCMIFNGKSISLEPSIGNWSFPCKSHYFIRQNKVVWAGSWSKEAIKAGRDRDRIAKAEQYDEAIYVPKTAPSQNVQEKFSQTHVSPQIFKSVWAKIKSWFV